MRGRVHRPIVLAAAALLAVASGCTMCPDPFDYTGPVPNGSAPQNDFRARSNGILPIGAAPKPWPPLVRAAVPQPASPGDAAKEEPRVADAGVVRMSAEQPAPAEAATPDTADPAVVTAPLADSADPADATGAQGDAEPGTDSDDAPANGGPAPISAADATPAAVSSATDPGDQDAREAADVPPPTPAPPSTPFPAPAAPRETPGWRPRR